MGFWLNTAGGVTIEKPSPKKEKKNHSATPTTAWLLEQLDNPCVTSLHCVSYPSPEDQLPPGFPTIDMGPQLKVVERTRTATMLCAASGNPDPDISWFKDFLPVNTTNNNGRIKQLRSGRSSSDESLMTMQGVSSLLLPSIWSALAVASPSVPSSSSSSHNLTSHLAFHFVGNGIVSTTSSVRPGVCCLFVRLLLSSSVVMGCWDCCPPPPLCVCWLLP